MAIRIGDNPPQDESHACEFQGCTKVVMYDDEPCCFEHSPDEGSFLPGYSYRALHASAQ